MSGVLKILLAVVLIVLLAGLVFPAIFGARDADRRMYCANNLKMIALAVENYHDIYGSYPTGTMPNPTFTPEKRLSWLVAILPFLEQDNLYNVISKDRAWDDQTNEAVNRKIGGGG
jgi:hypothetical protein